MKILAAGAYVNVDAIGYGASAAERLKDRPPEGYGIAAHPINVAERSEFTDRSKKYRMVNQRAEMYWRMREALDPEGDQSIALPPDPELLADLCAPRYQITPSGIKIESKIEIKARLGRSPDAGDATCLAMIPDRRPGPQQVLLGPPRTQPPVPGLTSGYPGLPQQPSTPGMPRAPGMPRPGVPGGMPNRPPVPGMPFGGGYGQGGHR
jgi:hypothetical protein